MRQFSDLGKYIAALTFSFLISTAVLAQDSLSNIDLDIEDTVIDTGPFYAQLWFWIAIGLVFLLLLIALLRGNGGKKKNEKGEEKDQEEYTE